MMIAPTQMSVTRMLLLWRSRQGPAGRITLLAPLLALFHARIWHGIQVLMSFA